MSSTHRGGTPPIETKVTWATAAAALAGWLLDAITTALTNTDGGALVSGVPGWIEPFLVAIATAAPTFLAGYQAKHTPRPDLPSPGLIADGQ